MPIYRNKNSGVLYFFFANSITLIWYHGNFLYCTMVSIIKLKAILFNANMNILIIIYTTRYEPLLCGCYTIHIIILAATQIPYLLKLVLDSCWHANLVIFASSYDARSAVTRGAAAVVYGWWICDPWTCLGNRYESGSV